jgi:hypothetical protein
MKAIVTRLGLEKTLRRFGEKVLAWLGIWTQRHGSGYASIQFSKGLCVSAGISE